MGADKGNRDKDNIFERHPAKSIFLVVVISILMSDFFAAHIYALINGYPCALREKEKSEKFERSYRIPSSIYNHDLVKNKCVKIGRGARVCTNSLGFKDSAIRHISTSSDKHRILFIGDSFTEGVGLDYKDSFVGMIDAHMSKQGIEVFNAAVVSYSPSIYWRKIKYLVEDVGLKLNEVVVFLDISDIEDEAIYYYLGKDGKIRREPGTIENTLRRNMAMRILLDGKQLIKNNSIIFYFMGHKLCLLLKPRLEKTSWVYSNRRSLWTINNDAYREYGERGLKKCDLYMNRLYEWLKVRNIKLTVAVYPWPAQVYYADLNSIQVSHWRDWCESRAVSFINYFPYFVTGKTDKERQNVLDKYYIRNEIHFNRNGHKLIANIFLDFYGRN